MDEKEDAIIQVLTAYPTHIEDTFHDELDEKEWFNISLSSLKGGVPRTSTHDYKITKKEADIYLQAYKQAFPNDRFRIVKHEYEEYK